MSGRKLQVCFGGLGDGRLLYPMPTPREYYESTGRPMTSEVKRAYKDDPDCLESVWFMDGAASGVKVIYE